MRSLFLLVALAVVGRVAAQQPGTLDTTFSGDGVLELSEAFMGSYHLGRSIAVSAVDDDLAVHFVTHVDSLVRFMVVSANGVVDTVSMEPFYPMEASALSQYGDIRIENVFPIDDQVFVVLSTDTGLCMIRLDANHQLDLSFSSEGAALELQWERFNDQEYAGLRKLKGGGYLLWGKYRTPLPQNNFQENCYFMLLNEGMQPDSSFGSNGALVLLGSVISNYPGYSVIGIGELSDSTIAVGLYYDVYGPASFGSASIKRIGRDGSILESSSIGCHSWSPGLNDFHVTEHDVILYSVAYCFTAISGGDTLFHSYDIGLNPGFITSGDNEMLYTAAYGWMIARRHPTGAFDEQFGEYYEEDGFTYRAQMPTYDGHLIGSKVLPDGKLLSWGFGTTSSNRVRITRHHNIPDSRSTLSLRMFLGGAYDNSTGLMRDDLRQQGLVPALQPFDTAHFTMVNGVGTWVASQHVLQVEGDSAVVDWVWLELLAAADSTTVVATRVGLLHRDGWVTSADGHSPIDFSAGTGSSFLRVRHRNHLSVTVAQPLTLSATLTTLDITDPATPTFGSDAMKDVDGVRMLWPGEARYDGVVKYLGANNDRDVILQAVGGSTPTNTVIGYRVEDLNMDGVVKYIGLGDDRDVILQTVGVNVPTAVSVEQVP